MNKGASLEATYRTFGLEKLGHETWWQIMCSADVSQDLRVITLKLKPLSRLSWKLFTRNRFDSFRNRIAPVTVLTAPDTTDLLKLFDLNEDRLLPWWCLGVHLLLG